MAVSLTSSGIVFPASSSLSATANVLDDYEEGATGSVMTRGGVTWQNYGTSTGTYTRIGRVVYLMMREESNNPGASTPLAMGLNYALHDYTRTSECGIIIRVQTTYWPSDTTNIYWYDSSGSNIEPYTEGGIGGQIDCVDGQIAYCYGQYYYLTTAA